MKMEDFMRKIKVIWKPFNGNLSEFSPLQFQQNLKEEKKIVSKWERDKNMKYYKVLIEVEESFEVVYNGKVLDL
jgi:hypothetical protein